MDPLNSLVDLVSASPWTYAAILAIAAIDALIPLVPSEATVIAARCGLRLQEVPVVMRQRVMGQSSLTLPLSIYYSIKVLVAVFVGIFRRSAYELMED